MKRKLVVHGTLEDELGNTQWVKENFGPQGRMNLKRKMKPPMDKLSAPRKKLRPTSAELQEFKAIIEIIPLDALWKVKICSSIENFSHKYPKDYEQVIKHYGMEE